MCGRGNRGAVSPHKVLGLSTERRGGSWKGAPCGCAFVKESLTRGPLVKDSFRRGGAGRELLRRSERLSPAPGESCCYRGRASLTRRRPSQVPELTKAGLKFVGMDEVSGLGLRGEG
jgi:hypothetical protein